MTQRGRRFFRRAFFVVLLIAIVYGVWQLHSAIVLHRAYARLRADGRPMTLSEIIPPYVSDSDNAAPLYLAAAEMLESESVREEYKVTISRLEYLYRVSVYLIFRAIKSLDYIEYAKWKISASKLKYLYEIGPSYPGSPFGTQKGLLTGRKYEYYEVSYVSSGTAFPDKSLEGTFLVGESFPGASYYTPVYEYMAFIINQPCSRVYKAYLSDLKTLSYGYLQNRLNNIELELFQRLMDNEAVYKAVELAEEGSKKSGCDFNIVYRDGFLLRLPHLNKMRYLNDILCARIRLMSSRGNVFEAWSAIIETSKVADSLKNELTSTSQIRRVSMLSTFADTIYEISSSSLPDPQLSVELQKILSSFEDIKPFLDTIDVVRIVGSQSLYQLFQKNYNDRPILHPIYKLAPWYKADQAKLLLMMHDWARRFETNNYSTINISYSELYNSIPRHYRLTRFLLPSSQRLQNVFYRMITKIRLTRISLAILDYHREHGSYPKNLEQIGAQNITDPFTSKPLIYRWEDNGFIIYSVGDDQTDDGGHRDYLIPQESKDIVLKYPKPPQPKIERNSTSYLIRNSYIPHSFPSNQPR